MHETAAQSIEAKPTATEAAKQTNADQLRNDIENLIHRVDRATAALYEETNKLLGPAPQEAQNEPQASSQSALASLSDLEHAISSLESAISRLTG